jgi:hypothetical protein
MKIRTEFIFPPIPIRSFDWSAVDDDTYDGHGSPIGYGNTEQAAIDDLLDQIEEREPEHKAEQAAMHANFARLSSLLKRIRNASTMRTLAFVACMVAIAGGIPAIAAAHLPRYVEPGSIASAAPAAWFASTRAELAAPYVVIEILPPDP